LRGDTQVSRQHVQVTVNSLAQRGLLRMVDNPKHERSRLVQLSNLGRDSFTEIRKNEAQVIDKLFAGMSNDALSATHHTLQSLYKKLR
jgi:DNA-binding MarR family transcriptional regulator